MKMISIQEELKKKRSMKKPLTSFAGVDSSGDAWLPPVVSCSRLSWTSRTPFTFKLNCKNTFSSSIHEKRKKKD